MATRNCLLAILFMCVIVLTAHGQFRLPPFDVELKVSEILMPANNDNNSGGFVQTDLLETTNVFGAAHLQFGQHLGVGWLYAQSFRGTVKFSGDDNLPKIPSDKASSLMYGPDIRYTTNRAKKTRFNLSLNYLIFEIVDDKGGYKVAHKSNALGLNAGLVKRLSNTVDLTIIELGAKAYLGEKAFWINSDLILEARVGVSFNFSKQK